MEIRDPAFQVGRAIPAARAEKLKPCPFCGIEETDVAHRLKCWKQHNDETLYSQLEESIKNVKNNNKIKPLFPLQEFYMKKLDAGYILQYRYERKSRIFTRTFADLESLLDFLGSAPKS